MLSSAQVLRLEMRDTVQGARPSVCNEIPMFTLFRVARQRGGEKEGGRSVKTSVLNCNNFWMAGSKYGTVGDFATHNTSVQCTIHNLASLPFPWAGWMVRRFLFCFVLFCFGFGNPTCVFFACIYPVQIRHKVAPRAVCCCFFAFLNQHQSSLFPAPDLICLN